LTVYFVADRGTFIGLRFGVMLKLNICIFSTMPIFMQFVGKESEILANLNDCIQPEL